MATETNYSEKIQTHIRNSRLQSNYLVSRFIKEFEHETDRTALIPHCIIAICLKFHFIDMTAYAKSSLEPGHWYNQTRIALDEGNYLLGIEMATYFVTNFDKNLNKTESFRNMYLALFYNLIALTYEDLKSPQQSEIYYQLSIQMDPKTDVWLWNYSELLTQQSRYTEAKDLLQKAVELKPDRLIYLFALGQTLENMNQNALAKSKYRQLLAKRDVPPDNGKNRLFRAVSFKKLDEWNNAQTEYEEYHKTVNKDQVNGNTRYAILLFALEKYDEALEYLNKAVKSKKDTAFTYYYIGLIMKYICKKEKAKEAFEKALDLCPIYPCCQREMESLSSAMN
eukprot:425696_1